MELEFKANISMSLQNESTGKKELLKHIEYTRKAGVLAIQPDKFIVIDENIIYYIINVNT